MPRQDLTGRSATKPIARSRASPGSGFHGPLPQDIWEVIGQAWEKPFAISGDFARLNAPMVALAASLGWISTITPDGSGITRRWHATAEGLTAMRRPEAHQ